MDEKRRIFITVNNHLHYGLILKNILLSQGKSTGYAAGHCISPRDSWEHVVEQTKECLHIDGKLRFGVLGLRSPLTFQVVFEYIDWKNKQGKIMLFDETGKLVNFGHGNLGEKIGVSITGHTEGSHLKLRVEVNASNEINRRRSDEL